MVEEAIAERTRSSIGQRCMCVHSDPFQKIACSWLEQYTGIINELFLRGEVQRGRYKEVEDRSVANIDPQPSA